MHRLVVALASVAGLGLVLALPAVAHGPCNCVTPPSGPPGTRVTIAYPIYKVIFNPDRSDLAIGPQTLWMLHRKGTPQVLYREPWRYSRTPFNDGGVVTIPRVAPDQ